MTITPDVRKAIGDELADILDLPVEERGRAMEAYAARQGPEPVVKLPRGPISNLRVETDRQMAQRLRRGG